MNVFCTPFLITISCYASLFFTENSALQGSTDKEVFDAGTIFFGKHPQGGSNRESSVP